MELNDLLKQVSMYDDSTESKEKITKAYNMADNFHEGQIRESGEKYIIHPLNVAYILSEMHADCDTICAGLLHDTLEDTKLTKKEIEEEFNYDVANLVDGVTKISKMNFSTKEEQHIANTKKLINGLTSDTRIIIIKLADRLHNMRTLQFKKEMKQKENSIETLEIFSPLAYSLGAYKLKNELEDISLKYLKPESYKRIEEKRNKINDDVNDVLQEMLLKIKDLLDNKEVNNNLKYRIKNIYGIYKKLKEGGKISDVHDLFALKVIVESVDDCYKSLGIIHSIYKPINYRFKDYICNPKTNLYQSLHSTVFADDDKLVQMQIRTDYMDKIDTYGFARYFDINKGNAREEMQKEIKDKYQFYRSLIEINKAFGDNQDFVHQVKKELFSDKIYVYTPKGDVIELPKGSTVIDFAYKLHTDLGNTMVTAIVNDEYVEPDYVLNTKDIVKVVTDTCSYGPRREWLDKVKTAKAKRKIMEFNKK